MKEYRISAWIIRQRREAGKDIEMKKCRNVITCAGGGGSCSTGTIEQSKAINCHSELRKRAEAQSENVKNNCHPELDSGSIQHCELPVLLDRSRNKFGMTLKNIPSLRAVADRVAIHRRSSRFHNGLVGLRSAFTMAEILLSLTIIGVVAAITLPSLTGNINERTWNTQRKALYARMSQAISLMPALNGFGTFTEGDSSTSAIDTAAETFITSGLSKVLKINNICDYEHLEDCGVPDKIVTLSASTISPFPEDMYAWNSMFSFDLTGESAGSYSQINTKAAAFETANGETIVTYYYPYCIGELDRPSNADVSHPRMCANFVYDLNGNKGPNTVGKDIGVITVFYPTDSIVVAPMPINTAYGSTVEQTEAVSVCKNMDSESRLPNRYEMMSMFFNKYLLGFPERGHYWTSSVESATKAWRVNILQGTTAAEDKTNNYYVRCVKR